LRFGDDLDNYIGALEYNHTSNDMSMYVNNATRMTINSSGNVGIGETSPQGTLHVKSGDSTGTASSAGDELVVEHSASNGGISILAPNTATSYLLFGDSDNNDVGAIGYAHSTNNLTFTTNASERMRIDSSGNVMIGATSTTKNFLVENPSTASGEDVSFRIKTNGTGSSADAIFEMIASTTGECLINFGDSNDANIGNIRYDHNTNAMRFITNTDEAVRIDSSGNLLVNSTSAGALASSGRGLIDVDGTSDSAIELKAGGSTYGYLYASSSQFRVANLTANPVTFFTNNTERVRIDGSGNVGIGTTSPSFNSGSGLEISRTNTCTLRVENTGTGASSAEFFAGNNKTVIGSTSNTHTEFRTNSIERMRIDTSGNVGIGTASPNTYGLGIGRIVTSYVSSGNQYALFSAVGSGTGGGEIDFGNHTVRHAAVASLNGSVLAFYTNGANSGSGVSERMRIDSSGNLLVGRTSTSYGYGTTGAFILSAGQIQTEVSGACLFLNNTSGTGTATIISLSRGNSGAGGIASSAGGTPSFVSASDAALKDNIQDHGSELNNVMAIQTRVWDWKDEAKGSGEGVVAQELEQTAWADLVSEGYDGYKQVSGLGVVETRLIKAIQEQQAMIEELKAEVMALKGE
jgi:hypothetical protein